MRRIPFQRGLIIAYTKSHEGDMAHVEYLRMEYDDAMRTISEAGARQQTSVEMRELGWGFQSQVGLATRAALCTDPASFSAAGRFVGFSILPVVVSAAPEEHYCGTAPLWRELDVSAQDIRYHRSRVGCEFARKCFLYSSIGIVIDDESVSDSDYSQSG
jgi:hypothetical protein